MQLIVDPTPISITPATLPHAEQGQAYSQQLTASGGSGSGYAFQIVGGTVPPGITLSGAGLLSGTPTQSGSFNFTIQVVDSAGNTAQF